MAEVSVPTASPTDALVRRFQRWAVLAYPLVVVVLVWEMLALHVVGASLLPPMSAILATTYGMLVSGNVYSHLFVSVYRVAIGLSLGIVVGVTLGIGMAQYRSVEEFFDVPLTLVYPIPKTALVPLAILWLGIGTETAVLVIFLGTLLPMVLNTYNGVENIDRALLWSAEMMGTSERRMLRDVVFPAVLPNILTGIQQAIPISFVILISAELVASRRGMGNLILSFGQLGQYEQMFAVIVIFSVVSFAVDRGFQRIRVRALVWQ